MSLSKAKSLAVLFAAASLISLAGCGGDSGDTVTAAPPPPAPPPPPAAPALVRTTQYGQIEGVTDGKLLSWFGVPFAKPPVGKLRWQPTQAPDNWTGVKPTKEYAEACAQIGGLFGPSPKGKDYNAVYETFYKQIGSEDCLYLNIQRPATNDTNLPVLVYIHGGSNVVGASFDPLYINGTLPTTGNVIVVTVAYRLGLFGWFAHPAFNTGDPVRDSGNFALLDLIQALKFVKGSISNFGGDPGNVTIAGQSAGSTNVNALVVSPMAAGLFHKAISMSGGLGGSSMTAAVNKANAIINAMLIKDKLATDKASADAYRSAASDEWIRNYLMTKTAADLYGLQVDPNGGKWGTGSRTFEPGSTTATLWGTVAPITDGTVQPASPANAVKAGTFNKVPMLVGNTAEEGKLFSTVFKVDDYTRVKWMNGTYTGVISGLKLEDVIDGSLVTPLTVENYNTYAYNNANKVVPAPSITTATFLGLGVASNTGYYGQVPIYMYNFKWNKQPAPWNDVYGAWHTEDINFMFGSFSGPSLNAWGWSAANEPGRLAMSAIMQKSVAAFMRTGNPNNAALNANWEQWAPTAPHKMAFDASLTTAIVTPE